jgi:hypothetical protein
MGKFDDFIEVEDNEVLFNGDEHLKINLPTDTEKKEEKKVDITTDNEKINDEDLIEVDLDEYNSEKGKEEEEELESTKPTKKLVKEQINEPEELEELKPEIDNEFAAFGSTLNEQGFFPDLEDEEVLSVKSEEDLQEKLVKQLNITFSQWQDQYKQNLINNLVKEGYISKEEVKTVFPTEVTPEQIKSDIEIAKEEIRRYYNRIGTPKKEIERIINSREDLEESALELNELNKKLDKEENTKLANKLKEQEILTSKQREQFTEELKKNTFDYDEFIPGRKLKKQDKEEVFLNIEPVLKKINQNLQKYAPLLSYLDKYGILEGKFDKFIKEGKTQSVSQLEQILKDKKKSTSSNTSIRQSGIINIDDTDLKKIYK